LSVGVSNALRSSKQHYQSERSRGIRSRLEWQGERQDKIKSAYGPEDKSQVKVSEMREKRAALAAQALEVASTDAVKFEKIMADVDSLKGDIDRQERAEKLDAELRATVRPPLDAVGSNGGKVAEGRTAEARAAFNKYIRTGDAEELRTYTPMSDGVQGAFIVPQGFQYELEQALKQYGGMFQVARILPTPTGNTLLWPTSNDTAVLGEQVAENTAVAQANPSIANVQLNAWKWSTKMVNVSNELLQDSAFDIDAYLRELFVARLGRILNQRFTLGVGTTEPMGITVAATAGPTAEGVGVISYGDLVELEHSVDPAYRQGAKFMLHDKSLKAIKKLKDGLGRPLWVPGVASKEPDTILSYPYVINQDMPLIGTGNKQMLFGAFDKYIIRSVKELSILRLTERFAEFGQTAFIGFARYDGNLIDAGTHPVVTLIGA
jgi:HK97 family phage major capsid protein